MTTIVTNSVLTLTNLPVGRTAGDYRYTLHGGASDVVQIVATPEVSFTITSSGSYSVSLERLLDDGSVWGSPVVSNVIEFNLQDNLPASITISLA